MEISFLQPAGLVSSPAFSHVAIVPAGATTIFVGGQNGVDDTGAVVSSDIAEQSVRAIDNAAVALAAAGASLADVVQWSVLIAADGDLGAAYGAIAPKLARDGAPPLVTARAGRRPRRARSPHRSERHRRRDSRLTAGSRFLVEPEAAGMARLPSSAMDHALRYPMRPVGTYSIVARDEQSVGVAVQSHWYNVGAVVPWVDAAYGAVAVQSFSGPEPGYRALEGLRAGTAPRRSCRSCWRTTSSGPAGRSRSWTPAARSRRTPARDASRAPVIASVRTTRCRRT